MPLTADDVLTDLQAKLSGTQVTVETGALIVPAGELTAVARFLRDTEPYRCDYLSNLTAADYLDRPDSPGRIEVVYHLYSMAKKHGPVTLKVRLPRENPAVASVTPLWRGAEFQEREVYDLFGVTFTGHPDLRRILMWDEFAGHPMRKDYVAEDQDAPIGQGG